MTGRMGRLLGRGGTAGFAFQCRVRTFSIRSLTVAFIIVLRTGSFLRKKKKKTTHERVTENERESEGERGKEKGQRERERGGRDNKNKSIKKYVIFPTLEL